MKISRIVVSVAGVVMMAFATTLPVFAASYGGGSVQGYGTSTPLDNGTIVQLTGKDAKNVKVATQSELQNMFGVIVDRNQLPLALSSGIPNEVFVAVSGTYNVLVSTQGGAIHVGDYVTLSSVNGVAMKASDKEKTVFGRAGGSFDGKSLVLGTTTLKDSSGKEDQKVSLGSIPVTVDIKRNPNIKSTKVNLPEPLQRLGQAIAEKEVSPLRMYLSIAIMIVSLIAALVVLYSGVKSGVISIGRNPMTKKSIFRALIEVIFTCLLILIVGMLAVYLLLKL